ncbi:MAG: DUF5666 domain-containing protein [Acidobacteriaceae bacterium]
MLCIFILPWVLVAQDAEAPPTVEGHITSITEGADFDVNGQHIVTTPKTVYWKHTVSRQQDAITNDQGIASTLAIGDDVQVFGKKDKHTHAIVATKVVLQPDYERVTGYAVVQQVIARPLQTILEADGYSIAITPKTVIQTKPPLSQQTAPAPNQWIAYSGKWNREGLVVADHVVYVQFVLSARAKKAFQKADGKFVPPDYENKKDGEIDMPYIGMASHKVQGPVPADLALQQRVARIGERLVPACQKDLAKDDPQKIDFSFYAFDDKDFHQAIGSPDGRVLIPTQVLQKLQNDDQIAAILADGMAQTLEREGVAGGAKRANALGLMELGEMPFVGPLAGIALISGGFSQLHSAGQLVELQSERVSLSLMQDAGFDVRQAPRAWQILHSKNLKDSMKGPPSQQSAYLLGIIGLEYAHGAVPTGNLDCK